MGTLEAAYWVALVAGLGLLAGSLVLGDVFDFLDFEIGGADFAATPVFFTATAAFGAGGLLGINAFELGRGGSVVLGLGAGAAFGGLAAVLFIVLGKQEAKDGFEVAQLVGQRARTTLAVGPGKTGRVTVQYAGMSRAFSATSAEEIAAGEDVVISDAIGSTVTVARASGSSPAMQ